MPDQVRHDAFWMPLHQVRGWLLKPGMTNHDFLDFIIFLMFSCFRDNFFLLLSRFGAFALRRSRIILFLARVSAGK
jgi:hypothetical protein